MAEFGWVDRIGWSGLAGIHYLVHCLASIAGNTYTRISVSSREMMPSVPWATLGLLSFRLILAYDQTLKAIPAQILPKLLVTEGCTM